MTNQGRFFEGQPDIREDFENRLVRASDEKIESLPAKDLLALTIGDQRTIYPSELGEYPQVLASFLKGGTFKGERVTPLVVEPLIALLAEVVLAFYREHLYAIMITMFTSGAVTAATRETLSKRLEGEAVRQAFKTAVDEVVGRNFGKVIMGV